jgi:hypothetical protein
LGLFIKFGLYRIPFDSGFGLDRFHCMLRRSWSWNVVHECNISNVEYL